MKLQSLKTRLILMVVVMLLLGIAAVSVVTFSSLTNQERRLLEYQREARAELLTGALSRAVYDIYQLVRLPALQGMIRTHGGASDPKTPLSYDQWREQVADFFRGVFEHQPDYLQIRFIGFADQGMELVRLERQASPQFVVEAELQSKARRPYVEAARTLAAGQVYISPLDLNVEHGQLELPHRPVMRVVAPVFGEDDERFGLVVINLNVGPLLKKIAAQGGSNHDILMTNPDGDYLVNPDAQKTFGFDLGHRYRLQDDYPQAQAFMDNPLMRSQLIPLDMFGKRLLYLQRLRLPGGGDRHLILADVSDVTTLFTETAALWRDVIVVVLAVLVVIGLVAWLFARWLTRPLTQLVQATQALSEGDLLVDLPVSRKDEIGGLARSFSHMATEVTDRERSLRTLVVRQMMAEETAQLGNWSWDLDADTVQLSEVARHIRNLEGDQDTYPVELMFDAIHPEERVRVRTQMLDAVEQREPFDVHCRLGVGEPRYVHVLGRPDAGNLKRYIGTIQDVSAQHQAEEQLKAYTAQLEVSNRELTEFAYVASHDLQEPLRKIQAFADRLKTKYGEQLDERAMDYMQRMQDSSSRMSTLINDLLSYSRLSTRAKPMESVNLNDVVRDVCNDLALTIDELGAEVSSDTLPSICAEPTHMRQLLQNLIGNALKFHRPDEPPRVRIVSETPPVTPTGLDRKKSYMCLSVIDNGIGFDTQYLERIFQPFQRLHGRDEYQGTGIGLATCRKIVGQHRGLITAESTPGEGTCFKVYLPVDNDCNHIKGAA